MGRGRAGYDRDVEDVTFVEEGMEDVGAKMAGTACEGDVWKEEDDMVGAWSVPGRLRGLGEFGREG